jgi:hypothetical protein
MSRAAAATASKGAQKVALKEKASTHAADLAMGLTSTMKKLMAGDTLICIVCRATTMGDGSGPGKCECPGGRTKPAPDYDPKVELLAAATGREQARKDVKKGESAAQQGAVLAAKEKKKANKELDSLADLDLGSFDMVDIAFEPGKLGMGLERHAVCSVAEGGAVYQTTDRTSPSLVPSSSVVAQCCSAFQWPGRRRRSRCAWAGWCAR